MRASGNLPAGSTFKRRRGPSLCELECYLKRVVAILKAYRVKKRHRIVPAIASPPQSNGGRGRSTIEAGKRFRWMNCRWLRRYFRTQIVLLR